MLVLFSESCQIRVLVSVFFLLVFICDWTMEFEVVETTYKLWERVVCYGLTTREGILGHHEFHIWHNKLNISLHVLFNFPKFMSKVLHFLWNGSLFGVLQIKTTQYMRTLIQFKAWYIERATMRSCAKHWRCMVSRWLWSNILSWYQIVSLSICRIPICLRLCKPKNNCRLSPQSNHGSIGSTSFR